MILQIICFQTAQNSGRKVFSVLKHKTSSQGPALFSLNENQQWLLDRYHQRATATFSYAMALTNKNTEEPCPPSRTYFFAPYPRSCEEGSYENRVPSMVSNRKIRIMKYKGYFCINSLLCSINQ